MDTTEHGHSPDMQRCIEECLRCHSSCLQMIQHCLELGGEHAGADHIRTLADCAEICQTSANFMLRGSPYHTDTCDVCSDICRACEQECRRFKDDKMMSDCADQCRRCADSCERMAKMAG